MAVNQGDPSPIIHSVSEEGVAAEHIVLPVPLAQVASAHSAKEHNTIKSSLVPFACWRANDILFLFESSFVLPKISKQLGALKELIDSHTLTTVDESGEQKHKPALTVFGHADPTGSDDFNKALSGRRAQAIYALLTRKVALWEDLYSNPLGNDKWEPEAIHSMQTALGQPASDRPSAPTRKALFKAYMDKVCTVPDENGRDILFEVKPTDFLAEGADAGGKGDYQGCGEFNPVFLQSQAEIDQYKSLPDSSPEKPAVKKTRDDANEQNRRVLVLLFRAGVKVSTGAWPCPRAKEGVEGCKKRFWSDGEKRRGTRLAERPRMFEETYDTFGCRFYSRLTDRSPCEKRTRIVRIRLFDREGRALLQAPFVLIAPNLTTAGFTSANGDAVVHDVEVPSTCLIRWSRPSPLLDKPSTPLDTDPPHFEFEHTVFLTLKATNTDVEVEKSLQSIDPDVRRLHNMGYFLQDSLVANIREFQLDTGQPQSGIMAEASPKIREFHDSLRVPRRSI